LNPFSHFLAFAIEFSKVSGHIFHLVIKKLESLFY